MNKTTKRYAIAAGLVIAIWVLVARFWKSFFTFGDRDVIPVEVQKKQKTTSGFRGGSEAIGGHTAGPANTGAWDMM